LPCTRSEEWGRRISALRLLLQEREGEVAELQRLLEDSQRHLEGGQALAAQQAQRVAALEERIRQLLRQLEAAQVGTGKGGSTAAAVFVIVASSMQERRKKAGS
jgi:hypothetical protein